LLGAKLIDENFVSTFNIFKKLNFSGEKNFKEFMGSGKI